MKLDGAMTIEIETLSTPDPTKSPEIAITSKPTKEPEKDINNCYYSSKYYLSNILSCEDCNNPFRRYTWTARGTTKYVWMCKVRKIKGGRKSCTLSPSIEENDLHFAIVHAINVAAKNIEVEDESSIVENNVQFNLKKD